MRDIFDLANLTQINWQEPYLRAYPYLIEYFSDLHEIGPSEVVRAAHMAYGWMPTILKMHWDIADEHLHAVAQTLTRARSGEDVTAAEMNLMASVVNNSLVGASKLLHFAAPESYPIWDSRVYRFVHEKAPYPYRLNNVDAFLQFVADVRAISDDPRITNLQVFLKEKLGYPVTAIRAAELIMFVHGANGTVEPDHSFAAKMD